MNRLKTGFLGLLLAATVVFGQKPQGDLVFAVYDSQHKGCSVDAVEDEIVSETAILCASVNMQSPLRAPTTNDAGSSQECAIHIPHSTALISIKKIAQVSMKNNIILKLRI